MKPLRSLAILFLLAGFAASVASAKVRIVASITDLGSIASYVGGEDVEVQAIARPTADVHRVEVLPSYMVRVGRAQLYLKVGLGLDGWADGIIDGSRNDRLTVLDCSKGIEILDKPTGKVDASMGDVHPEGNPHYWIDPRNGAIVARSIADALGKIDPPKAVAYTERAEALARAVAETYERGRQAASMLPGRGIITYHASWVYFARAFGLEVMATVEPIPGIPPTGRHLQELTEMIRQRDVRVILQEPYFSDEASAFLSRTTGIHVAKVSPSCETAEAGSYLSHFDQLFRALGAAD